MTLGNVSTIWGSESAPESAPETAQTAPKKKTKMLSTATANTVAASAIMQRARGHIGANSLSQV